MPPKIRELKRRLLHANFTPEPTRGKGSHVLYTHAGLKPVLIPHHDNDDALPYLVKQVEQAIQKAKELDR